MATLHLGINKGLGNLHYLDSNLLVLAFGMIGSTKITKLITRQDPL